jgi:large subunit ribosomal protein L9
MKIILLQDIDTLGKKYEIKEVKDGYARNFLIPQKMAKSVTKQTLKWLEEQRSVIEKEAEDDLKQVQELASKLDDLEVSISVKVGDEGQLFESVNTQKISEKLKEMGFEVKKSHIKLENPLKEAGEFPIKVSLPHNLESEIRVVIVAEAGEKEEI